MADLIDRDAAIRMLSDYAETQQELDHYRCMLMKIPAIENDYEQGFKDGITSECLEELKPLMVELTKGCTEAIKGIAPMLIDKAQLRITTAVNRWIPCSERLPENLTPVIITYASRYPIMPCYQKDKDKPYVGAAYGHNDKWFWFSVTCEGLLAEYGYSFADEMDDAIEVLAWMPMPDAYEPPESEVQRNE